MRAPSLIIFDCDGVLVDSEDLSCQCLSDVLASYGREMSVPDIRKLFLGRSGNAVFEYYELQKAPLPPEFATALKSRVAETFRRSLRPIEGVVSIIEQLDLPYCVASSSDPERLSLSLSVTGLAGYFSERCYTSNMVKHGKPAPDLFLHAAKSMKADPRQTVVIEDSVNGVRAGKAAQMTVWGFVGGSHHGVLANPSLLLDAGADRVFGRMVDFWPALKEFGDGKAD